VQKTPRSNGSPPSPSASTVKASEQLTSFELAAQRAYARYSAEVWTQLAPGERSQAIYEELRSIDKETARAGNGRR
jgi:hypothetical protein